MRFTYKSCPLYGLKTLDELINIVKTEEYTIDRQELEALLNHPEPYLEQKLLVDELTGKRRWCEVPVDNLKKFQERLHKVLFTWLEDRQPEYLFSFKGALENAQYHSQEEMAVRYDVHHFFKNTRAEKVYSFFKDKIRMAAAMARLLSKLCIYKGHLPTGAPTSPILSFLAYRDMWEQIYQHCQNIILWEGRISTVRHSYRFTLYIDDIVISGSPLFRFSLRMIRAILHQHGFSMAKGKTKWFQRGHPKHITGVIILPDGRFVAPHKTHWRLNEYRKKLTKAKTRKARKRHTRQILAIEQWLQRIEAVNRIKAQV